MRTCAQRGLAGIVVHGTVHYATLRTTAATTARTVQRRRGQSTTMQARTMQTGVVHAGGHVNERVVLGAARLVHRARVDVVQALAYERAESTHYP